MTYLPLGKELGKCTHQWNDEQNTNERFRHLASSSGKRRKTNNDNKKKEAEKSTDEKGATTLDQRSYRRFVSWSRQVGRRVFYSFRVDTCANSSVSVSPVCAQETRRSLRMVNLQIRYSPFSKKRPNGQRRGNTQKTRNSSRIIKQ